MSTFQFEVSTMVIMSNTIQAGWNFDNIDSIVDEISVGTNSSYKKNENTRKNDGEMILAKSATTHTGISHGNNTDEEGWTMTSPGRKKPKDNNKVASTESIITTIDGNIDQIDAGTSNRIYVTSPGRKDKCNIPDDRLFELDFTPTSMAEGDKERETGTDKAQDNGEDDDNNNDTNGQNNGNREENEKEKDKNKQDDGNKTNNDDRNRNNSRGNESGGRGGRGGRRGKSERKQTPRTEWETYDFSISFNPKTMINKNPDAEFQAVLSEIMKKSPGVTFHPTNEDMFPKPKPFTTIQEYPQNEAAFKDFFEVYANKGLTTYRIFLKATMQYNELDLRNSLLNYLRSNNLWMSSDLISENVDEMIGYISYGHDKLVWRPECEKKINNGIQALIQSDSVSEALKFKIEGLKKGIHVRVAAGTFRGGTKNDPVMCEGLVLRTTKAQARAAIELLGLMDENILGPFYGIVPRGIDKELGPKMYGDLLRANNDMLNTLRSIAVVNWPEELFLDKYNSAPDVAGTMAMRIDNLLLNVWNCVAIEKTTDTTTKGKYLLIFQEKDMEKAKISIGNLIEAFGRKGGRPTAKIALARYHEFPEFDSIQRVSQSVHSKGLRLRAMLETAAAQRTTGTPKKAPQQKFHFHIDKELQTNLPITTQKSYINAATNQKKLTIVQTPPAKLQPIIRQLTHPITQGTTPTSQLTTTQQEAMTVATNHSGLSIDQQTITTMMTHMTQMSTQFKEMETDRIIREDKNEMKRQEREDRIETKRQEREAKAEEKRYEREARMEEKRLEAETKLYTVLQTMMTITVNKNNNQDNNQSKELIPDELTTGKTDVTSALTTSIITTSTQSTKRSQAELSNNNEETEMKDAENGEEQADEEEALKTKRNKTIEQTEQEDEIVDDDDMNIDHAQQNTINTQDKQPTTETVMMNTDTNTSSFAQDFNNQQFKSKTNTPPWQGVSKQ